MKNTIFVGIPLHDGKIHHACVAGLLQLQTEFSERCAFETTIGSFLPRNRDSLVARFLDTTASHMLCLDSDIGFVPDDVKVLLDSEVDFVSGVYSRKNLARDVPAKLAGKVENGLLEAISVPAGFMLLSRQCAERMIGAYRKLEYKSDNGTAWALFASTFEPGKEYTGEDVAFCNRWRAIGGKIYINPAAVVRHYGDHCYLPDNNPSLKFLK